MNRRYRELLRTLAAAPARSEELPDPLAGLVAKVADGILGNSLFRDRTVGYFPRRGLLVLGAREPTPRPQVGS